MSMAARRERIEALLRESEALEVGELQRLLGVSRETIRKDLATLAEAGRITRMRGGAVNRATTLERAYSARRSERVEAKQAIAREAASMVPDGASVYLDYGTTTLAVAEELARTATALTVLTNAFPIAVTLAENRGIDVLMAGGTLRPDEYSLHGPMATRNLESLKLEIGFFGCAGVSHAEGVTNHHLAESAVSEIALRSVRVAVLVADATKVGASAFHRTAAASEIDRLITDDDADRDELAQLEELGVAIKVTRPGSPHR